MRAPESRVKVVGPALVMGAGLAAVFATKVPAYFPELWLSAMAGPFAGLWTTSTWSMGEAVGWAAVCGLAIAVHPLRAGWLTGTVSAVGLFLWVLFGLVLTYDGV